MFCLFSKVYLLLIFSHHSLCRKSDQKCEEYAKAVNVNQQSPVLSRRSQTESVSECGIVSVPLIIGGVRANEKEFPHMAVIGYDDVENNKIVWECGGSLISEEYILTAAHCLNSINRGAAKYIKLGTVDLSGKSNNGEQQRNVANMIAHPQYKKPRKYNDIALIKMNAPVEFTPYIRPACISSSKPLQNSKAIATGFGKLSYSSMSGSDLLMKVTLNMIDKSICEKTFEKDSIGFNEGFTSTLTCAGVLEGGKDTCQGDSGGPLQIILEQPYCMYNIIGVTSTGKFCGYENSPAIYTNVAEYLDWIENTVW